MSAGLEQEGPGAAFERLLGIMDRLRSPGGCPWDGRQTHASLVKHLIEESYEVVEAVEAPGGPEAHRDELVEELGDVLLQVVFHARIAQERGQQQGGFDIEDVVEGISHKLVRRHPEVLADVEQAEASDDAALHARWEELKRAEKPQRTGPFDGVPPGLPALQRTEKILSKARRHGLEPQAPPEQSEDRPRTQEQLGQALFELVRRASADGLDAERALREHSAQWARQRDPGRLPQD